MESDLLRLEGENTRLQKEMESLLNPSRSSSLRTEHHDEKRVDDLIEQLNLMRTQVAELSKQLDGRDQDVLLIEKLKEELRGKDALISAVEKKYDCERDTLITLKQGYEAMSILSQGKQAEVDFLKKQAVEMKESMMMQINQLASQLSSEKDRYEKQIATQEKMIKSLVTSRDNLRKQSETILMDRDIIGKEKKEQGKKQNEEVRFWCGFLCKQLENLRLMHAQELSNLNKTLAMIKDEADHYASLAQLRFSLSSYWFSLFFISFSFAINDQVILYLDATGIYQLLTTQPGEFALSRECQNLFATADQSQQEMMWIRRVNNRQLRAGFILVFLFFFFFFLSGPRCPYPIIPQQAKPFAFGLSTHALS